MKNFLCLMIFSVSLNAEELFDFQDLQTEIRYYQLIDEIRCPKCTSGSLASSNAPVSEDLKKKIFELLSCNSGLSIKAKSINGAITFLFSSKADFIRSNK